MRNFSALLIASLCTTGVCAQETESWYVNEDDGTLKSVYVANEDSSQMSVVEFATDNVAGTHTSGPISSYTDGETLPLEAEYNNGWGSISSKALSSDGSVANFYYVQGKGNPVNISLISYEEIVTDDVGTGVYRANWDDSYYQPDGSNGLPTNGTYVTLTPSVDGTMTVAAWINKGSREIYIVKESDMCALSLIDDVTVSGYVNGTNNDVAEDDPLYGYPLYQEDIAVKAEPTDSTWTEGADYVIGQGNQAGWYYMTFEVTANETYYVFNKSTQIGFSGFEFTPSSESTGISEITTSETTTYDPNAPVYNLAGQRVTKDTKGILIQNGRKVINR